MLTSPTTPLNSGMDTLESRGAGPVLQSLLPDTIIDRGTRYVDFFMSILRPNHRVRPRQFKYYLTLIPDAPLPPPPKTPKTQPGPDLVSPQQAARLAKPRAIIARLQSEIHILKMASRVPLSPVKKTEPVRRQ